ncbi:diacylglycerol/polyprenol kinase family protein [Synechococcus sp. PCC 6312]|uniref:diacylglycerol/polyprenol kinase family protein n=1 Tax=Synechococcus sp. (strain ATCC 27167 / PCC 6312) TaxID=195253 RepID=UPI00029F2C7D|nr:diacylglycerol/polyprenol kinase family protein [Synechococcus sp. PCC 6312]AFY59416.1 dolichol kinase [Synechococcus sp. PCC 6312]
MPEFSPHQIGILIQTHSLGVGVVIAWLGIVLLTAELTYRWTTWGAEVSRKIVHIGTGNIILLAWWFQIPAILGIIASIFFSGLTLLSYRYPVLPSVSGIGRQSWGTFFYAVSIGVLLVWFWPTAPAFPVLGILTMAYGDGLAAIIGQRWGRHPYQIGGIKKSWEGSLTMAVVTMVIAGLVLGPQGNLSWSALTVMALILGVVATGLEIFSRWGIDNLTVPLGTAGLAWGLSQLLVHHTF